MKQPDTVEHHVGGSGDICRADRAPEGYEKYFPQERWKWLMRNRDRNGLDQALIYYSDRGFLLSKKAFRAWLESRLGKPSNN